MPALEIDSQWPSDTQALTRLIRDRHSCRAFLDEQIPRTVIDDILTIAQGSASWCNSQPWQVIVTEGAETVKFRDALYDYATASDLGDQSRRMEQPDFAFPKQYIGIYKDRQRATGWALYESVGVAYGDRIASGTQMLENYRIFGAPHLMVVTTEADLGVYGAIDCGAYASHVMLAAQSFGVATITQAAIAGVAPFVRDWFAIPPERQIVCGIAFGRPDNEHPANKFRTERAPRDQVVTFHGDAID